MSKKIVIFLNGIRGIEVVKYLKKKNYIIDLAVVEKKEIIKILKNRFLIKKIYFSKNINKNYKFLSNFKSSIFISAGFSQIFSINIILSAYRIEDNL